MEEAISPPIPMCPRAQIVDMQHLFLVQSCLAHHCSVGSVAVEAMRGGRVGASWGARATAARSGNSMPGKSWMAWVSLWMALIMVAVPMWQKGIQAGGVWVVRCSTSQMVVNCGS
jgi:hypothetical protein